MKKKTIGILFVTLLIFNSLQTVSYLSKSEDIHPPNSIKILEIK